MERGWWFLGDEQFRQELLQQVTVGPGPSHYGEAVQESVEAIAERLLAEALKRRKWTAEDLARRRKGDAPKVELEKELRCHWK